MKNYLANALVVVSSLLIFFGIAESGLRFLPVTEIVLTRSVTKYSTPFDISARPNSTYDFSRRFDFSNARVRKTNNLGFFSDFDFVLGAAVDVAIGDSFVEAQQVDFKETFHQIFARGRKRPVYAIGVSGAPLSQYEAYFVQACKSFRIGKAIFTIIHNDFSESMFRHRPRDGLFYYYSDNGTTMPKPVPFDVTLIRRLVNRSSLVRYVYFNLGGGHVVRRLVRPADNLKSDNDGDARHIAVAKEAIDIFLERIGTLCLNRSDILFVVDADRAAIYGEAPQLYFQETRAYFIARARAIGYRVLDLQPVFAADFIAHSERFDYPYDKHWNARGHATIAAALTRALEQR